MDNTNPADWTDAEIARWMAERDGWSVEKGKTGSWSISGPKITYHGYTDEDYAWWTVRQYTNYPRSLDAAVGWLGRMGLGWMRYMNMDCVAVSNGTEWFTCAESDTCSTSRALCNAGAAAVMAREVRHA